MNTTAQSEMVEPLVERACRAHAAKFNDTGGDTTASMRAALDAILLDALPCDVKLPPATTIRAGCKLSTLVWAINDPERPKHFEEATEAWNTRPLPEPQQDVVVTDAMIDVGAKALRGYGLGFTASEHKAVAAVVLKASMQVPELPKWELPDDLEQFAFELEEDARHSGMELALTQEWQAAAAIRSLHRQVAERDEVLKETREAIMQAARDTLWCGDKYPAETIVDRIDALLQQKEGGRG